MPQTLRNVLPKKGLRKIIVVKSLILISFMNSHLDEEIKYIATMHQSCFL